MIGPHTHLLKPAEIMGIDAEQELQNSACNSKTFGVLHGNFEAEAGCQKGLEGGDIQLGKLIVD